MVDQVVKRALLRSPMAWIVLAIGVLHAVGLNWGLPNIDGWDDDGVAPRDFLVGLSQTYTPGQYYTYPPVHLLILAVVTSPITLVTLGKASSFAPDELVRTFLNPWTMTWFALLARVVTWVMSLGIVLALGQLAERVWGRIAGLATAVAVGLNATFCYYSHTSNLDVPYCFWACCSLLQWVRAMADHEPRRMRWAAVFAALAVGTKDQAYALFLLGIPLALALWLWTDGWARKESRQVFREVGVSLLIGAVSLLVLDGAVFNPTGFRARIAFLLGTASQDHAYYSKDVLGRWRLLVDSVMAFDRYYPWPVGGLVLGGLGA
ncbi:MAG: hypothetical protein WCI05_18995, partial [Myxococcales bacterium]